MALLTQRERDFGERAIQESEQEENEKINEFELRVRSKASICECTHTCKKCNYSREDDEIKMQILCKMNDRDLQKEMWRKREEFKTLDSVLGAIRTAEAVADHQESVVGHTNEKENKKVMKCFNCEKPGHKSRDCLTKKMTPKSEMRKPAVQNLGCGFCGGKERCSYKNCRAYTMKCNQCHKFGHIAKCCNATTRPRARDM